MHITVEKLTVAYGDIIALNNIDLSLTSKKIGLLGRNGAGKTTFIKTLLGLVKPLQGTCLLKFKDRELNCIEDYLLIRARVGYMPEDDFFIEEMTPFEYITYSAMLGGIPRSTAISRSHFILELCGIKEERYRPIKGLSKGMRQKVKLAHALSSGEELFLLDEPASALDPDAREEMLSIINKIPEYFEDCGFILSTHITGDVEKVCDYIVVIDNGEIKFSGPLSSLKEDNTGAIEVIVKENKSTFLEKLKQLGASIIEDREKLIIALGYDTVYKTREGSEIKYKKGNEIEFFFHVAKDLGSTIRHIQPLKKSLESLFIQVKDEKLYP